MNAEEDAIKAIMDLVESGKLERCCVCGKEKRGEMAIVKTKSETDNVERMECMCYDCLKKAHPVSFVAAFAEIAK